MWTGRSSRPQTTEVTEERGKRREKRLGLIQPFLCVEWFITGEYNEVLTYVCRMASECECV